MVIAVAIAIGIMMAGANGGLGIPGRMQALAEMAYEFVAGMVRSAAGEHAMKFFPLVFSLFMFILICNLVGLVPHSFTVIIVGIKENGLHFFKLFVPSGVPIYILPLVVLIEVISFLSRPLSHSVRLFANMLAGHITLNVFGGFVVMLLSAAGAIKALAVLAFAMTIGLEAL